MQFFLRTKQFSPVFRIFDGIKILNSIHSRASLVADILTCRRREDLLAQRFSSEKNLPGFCILFVGRFEY